MRKLLLLASAMVFLDVVFYSAIAPLLPTYVDELGLGKAAAGVLSAAYAAGTLVASLPAGVLVSRVGPRRTVIAGLLALGCASLAFGFVREIALLDAARFAQGAAGALIWTGALAWLIASAPEERRGAVIGTALGTAVGGALLGPALGALAGSVGTRPVFGSVLLVAVVLCLFAGRLPAGETERRGPRRAAAAMLTRPVRDAVIFVTAPSVMFGAVGVLVPLRISSLGGGHALIAAGFIAGAALEATLAPLAGRYSDRAGRRLPYVGGLAVCALAILAVGVAQALGTVLGALIASSLGAGLCFAPAMTMLSDAAAVGSLHQGFAAGLANMAWAAGQVGGGVFGGVLAGIAGDALPSLLIMALLLATALYARRALVARPPGPLAERPTPV